ncbi:hypothetical protein ATERTT37_005734 [Aspergillus terreus]
MAGLGDRFTVGALGTLVVLGMLKHINDWLSKMAHNGYTKDLTWNWAREIVILTGGSSGIGAAIAAKLSESGSTIIILDINPPLQQLGKNVFFYKTNIASSTEVQEVADRIRQEHGDPTVLINNAGIGSAQLILDQSDQTTRQVFEVNILAHFYLVRQFLPAMINSGHGHVVTVASMASFLTQSQNVDYGCTKAAALAFHEGLGQELKHRYNASKVRTT